MIEESDVRRDTVLAIGNMAMTAIRTAPKTKGRDTLCIKLAYGDDMEKIADAMDALAESDPGKKGHFDRDAANVRLSQAAILVGARNMPVGMNCGWCGFPTCAAKPKGAYCVFNSMDLGIGLGSAVADLAGYRVDNRIMYSIGYAALELKLFPEDIAIAIGIPLSVSGKSPFFDRVKPA